MKILNIHLEELLVTANNPQHSGYQRELPSMVYKLFFYKTLK